MKNICSKNATRPVVYRKLIGLLILLYCFLGSCKKEILTDRKPDELITAVMGSSLKPISYPDFLQRVDLNKIGNISQVFRNPPKESLLKTSVMGNQDYQFEIETSQVMEVKLNGRVSYVFPIKLASKYARSFSNLTIDIKDGVVKTFINTYTPTDKWINDWRDKKLTGAFKGEVSYQEIPNDFAAIKTKTGTTTMYIECFSWMEAFPEAYPCDSDDRHMPWEACEWAGKEGGPGYRMAYQMKTVCYSGGGGGGTGGGGDPIGGGGGGTGDPNTNPFPPSTYQPCGEPPSRPRPGVPPCEEPTLVEHLIYNLRITDPTQINYLNSPLRRTLVEQLSDHLYANVGSLESQDFSRWVVAHLAMPGISEDEVAATQMSLAAVTYDFSVQNTVPHFNAISPYLPNAAMVTPQIYAMHFTMKCVIIKAEHPEYPKWQVYWEASKEMIHLLLDGVGLAPGIGEIADLTNGLIYAIEGDGVNASLSLSSAVPFFGWFAAGAKMAKKTIQLTATTKTTLVWVRKANNIIGFGDRAQLRKVLKLAVGDTRQAHHIIPWAKQSHPAVQKAAIANGKNPFHMNDALNGIPLSNSLHLGSHTHYDNLVQGYLQAIPANATPDQALDAVNALINKIRTAINNNPGVHINQLNF